MPCGDSSHGLKHSRGPGPKGRDPRPVIRPAQAGTDRDPENVPSAGGAARAGPPLAYTEIAAKPGYLLSYVLICSVRTHACYFPLLCPTAPFREFVLALHPFKIECALSSLHLQLYGTRLAHFECP